MTTAARVFPWIVAAGILTVAFVFTDSYIASRRANEACDLLRSGDSLSNSIEAARNASATECTFTAGPTSLKLFETGASSIRQSVVTVVCRGLLFKRKQCLKTVKSANLAS